MVGAKSINFEFISNPSEFQDDYAVQIFDRPSAVEIKKFRESE
jgi:hypothetical protein